MKKTILRYSKISNTILIVLQKHSFMLLFLFVFSLFFVCIGSVLFSGFLLLLCIIKLIYVTMWFFIMSLTDTKLRNIKSPYSGKPELADRDGLTARIATNGSITFNYRFRWLCKQQRIKIGRYPDIKLSDARIKSEVGSPTFSYWF